MSAIVLKLMCGHDDGVIQMHYCERFADCLIQIHWKSQRLCITRLLLCVMRLVRHCINENNILYLIKLRNIQKRHIPTATEVKQRHYE